MKMPDVLGYELDLPVVIDRHMAKDAVMIIDGQLHVHSEAALRDSLLALNQWVLLATWPPVLMHRTTGVLVDAPLRACPRCGGDHLREPPRRE